MRTVGQCCMKNDYHQIGNVERFSKELYLVNTLVFSIE